jgi:hypothetical protein
VARYALKLAAFIFAKPGELRQAELSEVDKDKEWRIPAAEIFNATFTSALILVI